MTTALQLKADSWYCQFIYKRQRYTFTVGKVDELEARAVKAKVEYLLMRIKQHLLDVPAGMDIVTFIEHDGKPPDRTPKPGRRQVTFTEFRDRFLKTFSGGGVEGSTLYTAKIHLAHLAITFGEKFPMNALTASDLQRHIDRRRSQVHGKKKKEVSGTTIRKEIETLRAAWNWAVRMGMVEGELPAECLVYPKGEEKLPFMTKAEIERRIDAGGEPDELWECLFLTLLEIEDVLAEIKQRAKRP